METNKQNIKTMETKEPQILHLNDDLKAKLSKINLVKQLERDTWKLYNDLSRSREEAKKTNNDYAILEQKRLDIEREISLVNKELLKDEKSEYNKLRLEAEAMNSVWAGHATEMGKLKGEYEMLFKKHKEYVLREEIRDEEHKKYGEIFKKNMMDFMKKILGKKALHVKKDDVLLALREGFGIAVSDKQSS